MTASMTSKIATSDIGANPPAYAGFSNDELSSAICEMETVIDGMINLDMGISHELRLLGAMKEEQARRAA